jgi:hypothetical protein
MRRTENFCFDLTTESGREYEINGEAEYSIDTNAKCDADGRRGTTEIYLEHFEIHSVYNTEKQIDLLDRLNKETLQKINDYVYKQL